MHCCHCVDEILSLIDFHPSLLVSQHCSGTLCVLPLQEFEYLWPQLDLLVDGGMLNDTDKARLGSTVVDLSQKGKFRIIREGRFVQYSVLELPLDCLHVSFTLFKHSYKNIEG